MGDSPDTRTRRCRLTVGADLLARLLGLPAGARVSHAEFDHPTRRARFYVEGAGYLLPDGHTAPDLPPAAEITAIVWNFPPK